MQSWIIHMHAATQLTNKNKGRLVLKYNIHQRQHTATFSLQALDIWSGIFYTCWYWSVKPTCAATPPFSVLCAPSPLSPTLSDLSLTPSRREGYSAPWGRWLGSFCYRRPTLALLVSHRWCNHYRLLPCQASVCDTDRSQSFFPRITAKTSPKVFCPTALVVE